MRFALLNRIEKLSTWSSLAALSHWELFMEETKCNLEINKHFKSNLLYTITGLVEDFNLVDCGREEERKALPGLR